MVPQSLVLLLAITGPLTEAKAPWFQIGFAGGGLGVFSKGHISFQRVTGINDYKVDPTVPPRWEADLYTENSDLSGKVTKTHQRADGRVCHGITESLRLLARIPALKPQSSDAITEQWIPAPPADGAVFYYNRYGRVPGSNALYSESFGDAQGQLLQPIWARISSSLRPCWTSAPD